MDPENHHPSVHLVAGGFEDDVDEGLVPILRLAWEIGIETMSGCQDAGESLADLPKRHPHMADYVKRRQGWAYIDFFNDGIEAFLTMVLAGEPSKEMWYRMYHWLAPDAWQKSCSVHTLDDDVFHVLGAKLSFPVYDIDEIAACLERASV